MKLPKPLNKYFDHTLLKPEATNEQIDELVKEAKEYDFYSVCVNTCYVSRCYDALKDTDVKVAAVVGFPLGACTTQTKVFETQEAFMDGAGEVDMVLNVGKFKSGDNDYVRDDIRAVADAAHSFGGIVKVILETCLLTSEEIVEACKLSMEAGADFVKTSTGFGSAGASTVDVALMMIRLTEVEAYQSPKSSKSKAAHYCAAFFPANNLRKKCLFSAASRSCCSWESRTRICSDSCFA